MRAVLSTTNSLIEHWPFARAMAARDLKKLNRGAALGYAWLILRPLIQVAAYVVIVTYVFGARPGSQASRLDYVLYVLSGLVAWQAVQRALEEAPSLIRERMEILKQVVYPLETLPLTAILVSGVGPIVGLCVYLVIAFSSGQLPWSVLLLPIPMLLLLIMILGLSYVFMIAGVLLKDLREIVSVILGLAIYFSPVLLSKEMVGEGIWSLVLLNPLSHIVICVRDVLRAEFHDISWLVFAVCAVAAFAIGSILLYRAKLVINEYI